VVCAARMAVVATRAQPRREAGASPGRLVRLGIALGRLAPSTGALRSSGRRLPPACRIWPSITHPARRPLPFPLPRLAFADQNYLYTRFPSAAWSPQELPTDRVGRVRHRPAFATPPPFLGRFGAPPLAPMPRSSRTSLTDKDRVGRLSGASRGSPAAITRPSVLLVEIDSTCPAGRQTAATDRSRAARSTKASRPSPIPGTGVALLLICARRYHTEREVEASSRGD
jgi:hypothetical protein